MEEQEKKLLEAVKAFIEARPKGDFQYRSQDLEGLNSLFVQVIGDNCRVEINLIKE